MNTPSSPRTGPLGSLIDVYESTLRAFVSKLNSVSHEDYEAVVMADAANPDCRSIQSMMRHVILAGYAYANYVRARWNIPSGRPDIGLLTIDEAVAALEEMMSYTIATFEGKWGMSDRDLLETTVKTRWGPMLDLEVLLEHAICHLLRHSRSVDLYARQLQDEPNQQ